MNKVILIGRPTKDPIYNETERAAVARYTLAVNRRFNNSDQTDYIEIVAFNDSAKWVKQYIKKGKLIAIEGSIKTGSYEKDGRKVYTTVVVAGHTEFCERKGTGTEASKEDDFMKVPDGVDEALPFL